jgi:RNA polymerase sigma-70 factor (sigma-E family)
MDAASESEFDTFVDGAWARLFRTAYALTGDHQLAEDAVQSACAKAYASWPRIQRMDQPEAYVRRIVTNQIFSWRRRMSWRSEQPSQHLMGVPTEGHEAAVTTADEVWGALRLLPPRQRAVVALRYYEDLSENEIAQVLGIRPGTVKSQCSAAMRRLRELIEPDRSPAATAPPAPRTGGVT